MNATQTNREALNATFAIRHFVVTRRPTIGETYAELVGLGIAGDLAEDVLDGAGVTVTAEQISDLDPIVFRAIAQAY